MRDVNLSGLDLNLLPPLEALLRRRNVTWAASDVGLSQPAMSRALARLRAALNDPLLVRGAGGFVLTARAQELAPRLAAMLGDLKGLLQEPVFDPVQERRTIRIAAADVQTILLAPDLMARLAREAPGVDIRVESYGLDPMARLENGTLDLAFALSTTPLPPGALSESVAEDRLAVIVRKGHPAAGRSWTIADYGRFDHVAVALVGDGQSQIDAVLAAAGLRRRVALVTPHFMAALSTVAGTDLVTTISRTLAERFAPAYAVVLIEPPFADVGISNMLVWSHVRARDPLLAWLRGVIREVAQRVYGAGDMAAGEPDAG